MKKAHPPGVGHGRVRHEKVRIWKNWLVRICGVYKLQQIVAHVAENEEDQGVYGKFPEAALSPLRGRRSAREIHHSRPPKAPSRA